MTLPEALARVERLIHWYREAEKLTERQEESADALILLLAEAHRAQRLREALTDTKTILSNFDLEFGPRIDAAYARLAALLETP